MGLEVLMARDQQQRLPRWRYQRLRGELVGDESSSSPAVGLCKVRRQLRLRRRVVAGAGVRSRSSSKSRTAPMLFRKKVRLMRLVFLLPAARRVAALLAEVVRRLAAAAAASVSAVDECPTIVFSSQWGLPVLSHSASSGAGAGGRNARLRAFYLDRSLFSSSAAASPC